METLFGLGHAIMCAQTSPYHTIRKYKKMTGDNTFQILVLNDANMIGEH